MDYAEFLQQKQKEVQPKGFVVPDKNFNAALFDFQRYCVKKSLEAGRFALFEDCGLGKTIQELEWCDKVCKQRKSPVLILAPLAVTGQTIEEAGRKGMRSIFARSNWIQ